MKPLSVAVVGAGHLGTIHTRLLQSRSDADVAVVVEPNPAARQRMNETLNVPTVASIDELPQNIEAVLVAAPTSEHVHVAAPLLKQGLHVFVEKPLTATLTEAEQLVQLAAEHNCVLQVGHSERFNAGVRSAWPLLKSCRHIRAIRESGFPSRSLDVGVVFDLMIHEIDLVLSLKPGPIVQLSAHGTTVVGPHEDIVSAHLVFANGLVADLHASRVSPTRERSWQVVTDQGLVWIDLDSGTAQSALAAAEFNEVQGRVHQWPFDQRSEFADQLFTDFLPKQPMPVRSVNAIVDEHDEFVSAICLQTPVSVDGVAGQDAVALAEQIVASIGAPAWVRSHQQVVPKQHRDQADAA